SYVPLSLDSPSLITPSPKPLSRRPLSSCLIRHPPRPPLFPYTTLFRSHFAPATRSGWWTSTPAPFSRGSRCPVPRTSSDGWRQRSEEHTSELQSRSDLVCRLLLEKKKQRIYET